jgi:hypothetical protein
MSEPNGYYRQSPAWWWLIGLIVAGVAFWALFAITHWINN